MEDTVPPDCTFTSLTTNNLHFGTPVDAFLTLFDEDLINKIHFQTNLYCTQKDKVGNISRDEILVFLGILIIMACHGLSTIKHYWMKSADMGVILIQESMPRDQFTFILGKLHLNDNNMIDPTKRDKLYKVNPLIESLNN